MREMVETYKEGNIGIKLDLFYGPSMSQSMISLGANRLSDVINTYIQYIKPAVCLLFCEVYREEQTDREREPDLSFSSSSSSFAADDNFCFFFYFFQSPPGI